MGVIRDRAPVRNFLFVDMFSSFLMWSRNFNAKSRVLGVIQNICVKSKEGAIIMMIVIYLFDVGSNEVSKVEKILNII